MAKRKYSKPQVEKVDFDYIESVVACPSGCANPSHSWHAGNTYPACYGNNSGGNNSGGNNSGGSNSGGNNSGGNNSGGNNPYYAPGWGLGCS